MLEGGIPDPQADIGSLLATCQALKRAVEGVTGQRASSGSPTHTIADTPPASPRRGDLWTRPSGRIDASVDANYRTTVALGSVLSVWDGIRWLVTGVGGEYYERVRTTNTTFGALATVFTSSLFGAANQIWLMEYTGAVFDSTGASNMVVQLADEASTPLAESPVTTAGIGAALHPRASAIIHFDRPRTFLGRMSSSAANGNVVGVSGGGTPYHYLRGVRLL